MKFKTSMKITKNFKHVFTAPYGDLQYIFAGQTATAYNSGVYGWNCDIYLDYARNICITTGYRNTRGKRIPNDIILKYDKIIKDSYGTPDYYNTLDEARNRFLDELIQF